jgi:hypothetical protein
LREEKLTAVALIGPFVGLVPLFIGFLYVLTPSLATLDPFIIERALIGYGALFLAFLGGVRWGFLIAENDGDNRVYLLGATGSILGFVALLLPFGPGLALLTVGFAGQGAWDVWSGWRKLVPESYARHRATVTFSVCLLLIATLLVYAARG